VLGSSAIRVCLLVMTASYCLLLSNSVSALPIKPKLKDVIDEAKKPAVNYPPARAGWNGPEEKSAVPTPNAEYDKLRYSISPAAAREQLVEAAKPDWRALLGVGALIFSWRWKRDRVEQRRAKLLAMTTKATGTAEVSSAPPHSRAA
jgi:hypothetical protein